MPGRRTRESALDTSPPANTSAAVSPMGERGGASDPQPGTGRARCVPDQPVIWGISRPLADSPALAPSCGYAAHGGPANVFLSSRSRVRVAVGAQVRGLESQRKAWLGAKLLGSCHVRDEVQRRGFGEDGIYLDAARNRYMGAVSLGDAAGPAGGVPAVVTRCEPGMSSSLVLRRWRRRRGGGRGRYAGGRAVR